MQLGELTPSELLQSCLDRIDIREPEVGAWEVLDIEDARLQAKALDDRAPVGPLHGVPVGVKDIIDVAGLPTRCGSPVRGATPATTDAWIVRRLREAGAVILGKTVTTEFAYFTPGKTRNPHDVERTPGGSSSGSAAAVADRMVPLALGTQTAASTTRPAAYCGVAGLVMAPGRLDDAGITGLSPTLDSIGFLGRSIGDLQLAVKAVSGLGRAAIAGRTPALRVCSAEQFGDIEPAMREAMASSVAALHDRGARVERLGSDTVPASLVQAHLDIMAVEATRSLTAESGHVSAELQALLDQGLATPAQDYRQAIEHARRQRDTVIGQLQGFDAILAPAALGPAPRGMATGSPVLSRPWQVMGLSSVVIPGLRDADGMPLGLQLIGRPDDVAVLLAAAEWVEQALTRTFTD
ncbi:hypothetical protein BVU76_00210 [Mycolicibacterium porcinum]|nr:hypothetical protein BVU76_00210 [Mycolicibacterium porcinum]